MDLAETLRRRAADAGCDGTVAYLDRLERDGRELRELTEDLTVTESYFFRNFDQFRALGDAILPERARTGRYPLRVLSAGCAAGEEAYSIAMLVHERFLGTGFPPVEIRAFDVRPSMIRAARRAAYRSWSLRETPAEVRERYFHARGDEFHLTDEVRGMVRFEERNLAQHDGAFWAPEEFDVVFCRNVVMYLTSEAARTAIDRIARSLVTGGYLFLGHAETLRGISNAFHLRHTHETFYYQLHEGASMEPPPAPAGRPVAPPPSTTWIDAIRQASERIASLATPPEPEPSVGMESVLDLLRRERFREAMQTLGALPVALRSSLDARLLRAVLLTNAGDPREAESECRDLLTVDELNAGAHYVMALCREQAGDPIGAADHDETAAYLDPAFAMPRLHLGLLARRAGAAERARRELGRALDLLDREDASRVLLFGGGLSRSALMDLCRSSM